MRFLTSGPMNRWLLVLLFVMACQVGNAVPASAHARLEQSTPASGSALDVAPSGIELRFSEPVVPGSIALSLTHADGAVRPLDQLAFSDADRQLTVADLSSATGPGTYSLRWTVVSAVDGHGSSGVVVFSVGTGRAPADADAAETSRESVSRIAARAIWLIAFAVIAASILLAVRRGHRLPPMLVASSGLVCVLTPLVLHFASLDLRTARLEIAAGVPAAVSAGITWARPRLLSYAAPFLWATGIALIASAGHAAGTSNTGWAIALSTVHMALALGWLGMLIAIVATRTMTTSWSATRRFSVTLIAGIALLVVAGMLTVPFQLDSVRQLRSSTYGQTLLFKQILVVLSLALAGTNLLVVRPWQARRSDSEGPDRQSRAILWAECLLVALTVGFGAALSSTSPPASTVLVQVASPITVVAQQVVADPYRIALEGTIAGTVDDTFRLSIRTATGEPATNVERLILGTSYIDPVSGTTQLAERFDLVPLPETPGAYSFRALRLPIKAAWTLDVTIRQRGLDDATTSFVVDTTTWQAEHPRPVKSQWRLPTVPIASGVLLALAIGILVIGLAVVRRQPDLQPVTGAVIIVALCMIATGFAIQAYQRTAAKTEGHDLAGPGKTDPAAAAATFTSLCLACHGPGGAGIDQIDPDHVHGSGTDLTDYGSEAISDGDLYWLISNGVGGTDMPAYDIALNDQQRWNLVAYLRQLQDQSDALPSP